MPIDPLSLVAPELVDGLSILPKFEYSLDSLPAIRQGLSSSLARPVPPELESVGRDELWIPGPEGAPEVRVLLYRPPGQAQAARPALLHIHGGGYILGVPEMLDVPNRQLAVELDCVIASVDYRLAPETPFPGPIEDCYAALCWLHDSAEDLGIDRARVAIGGESAGGGHAAALAIYARDKGGPSICFQLLDCPMLDDRTGTGADPHPHTGHFVWTPASNRFGWGALLGVEPGGPDVPANGSPARVEDLSGLPPAFIQIGALDLFLEESLEYTRRLTRAGVPVELHVVPGGYHGFTLASDAPQTRLVNDLRAKALARAFTPRP